MPDPRHCRCCERFGQRLFSQRLFSQRLFGQRLFSCGLLGRVRINRLNVNRVRINRISVNRVGNRYHLVIEQQLRSHGRLLHHDGDARGNHGDSRFHTALTQRRKQVQLLNARERNMRDHHPKESLRNLGHRRIGAIRYHGRWHFRRTTLQRHLVRRLNQRRLYRVVVWNHRVDRWCHQLEEESQKKRTSTRGRTVPCATVQYSEMRPLTRRPR